MANLKIVKDLASIKGLTIEALAAKAGVSTQAIHLMGRSGKTKIETLEKIAEILEVPAYVFFDENFDVQMFRDYIVQGHHNPTSFFGPIYNGDGLPPDGVEDGGSSHVKEDGLSKEHRDLIIAKEETIVILRKQVEDLLADKSDMRSTIQSLRAELDDLKRSSNGTTK